ncbi:MAG: cytochrome c oxidase subunit II [Actinomycetota bacterium]|nr:cytochrome c oxidase subunit II [Actinomycetota bacterium]
MKKLNYRRDTPSGPGGRRRLLGRAGWRTPVALGGAALALSACNVTDFGMHTGATSQGSDIFHLYQTFIYMAMGVAIVTFGALLYVLLRYGRRKGDGVPRQRHSNVKIEIVYTVIPAIIVAVIFFMTVGTENKVDAVSHNPSLNLTVTGFQWGWRFTYPDGVSVVSQGTNYPQMVLPEGETTKVKLVSQDVVHGFYVPAFNFSRYALPGVTNYFDLTPNKLGTFIGRCSQLCGLYHAEMLFSVRVVTPAQFNAWLSSQGKGATA